VKSSDRVLSTEYAGSRVGAGCRWLVAAALLLALVGGGWYLAQIILRVPGEHGTLIVELFDETLAAEVAGKKITFRDLKDNQKQFELAPGDGVVIFRDAKTGADLYSEKFELKKGAVTRVKASIERVQAARQQLDPKNANGPDRRAGEWVLSIGGAPGVFPAVGSRSVAQPASHRCGPGAFPRVEGD
jgi:hypothetical protein